MSDFYVCRGCLDSVQFSQYNELDIINQELFEICTNLKVRMELPNFSSFSIYSI